MIFLTYILAGIWWWLLFRPELIARSTVKLDCLNYYIWWAVLSICLIYQVTVPCPSLKQTVLSSYIWHLFFFLFFLFLLLFFFLFLLFLLVLFLFFLFLLIFLSVRSVVPQGSASGIKPLLFLMIFVFLFVYAVVSYWLEIWIFILLFIMKCWRLCPRTVFV